MKSKRLPFLIGTVTLVSLGAGVLRTRPLNTKPTFQLAPGQLVSVTSSSVVRTPYNWRRVGKALQAWNSGASLRCYFSGSTCKVNFDQSGVLEVVQVRYRVDNSLWSKQQEITPVTTELKIEGIKGEKEHVVEIVLDATPQNSSRWDGVQNLLRVVSFDIGKGRALTRGQVAKRALFYGDSIWEGIEAINSTQSSFVCTYAYHTAEHLRRKGYEVGIVACGFGGWQSVVPMGVTHAFDSPNSDDDWWDMLDSSTPRVAGAKWTDGTPDLIVTEWGANDSLQQIPDDKVQSSVEGFLRSVRATAPTTRIVISVPVGQYKRLPLARAVQANQDQKTTLLDMGPTHFAGFPVHPNTAQHSQISTVFISQLDEILMPTKHN